MHSASLASVLVAAFVVGACGPPAAVAPTLSDLDALGYRCDRQGTKGNEPNDLYQWHCRTPLNADPERGVLLEGNEMGVNTILMYVDSEDPSDAKAAFAEAVHEVRLLSPRPELATTIATWDGVQEYWDIDDVRLTANCSDGECRIGVLPVAGPLVPLPLR